MKKKRKWVVWVDMSWAEPESMKQIGLPASITCYLRKQKLWPQSHRLTRCEIALKEKR